MCAKLQTLLKPEEKTSLEREIANATTSAQKTGYGNKIVLLGNNQYILFGRKLLPLTTTA